MVYLVTLRLRCSYSNGPICLTEAFVDKLFNKCITYDGEMDYRTYVDFVLAMENKKEPQSIQYLFRVIDINQKGYLDASDLHYFYKVCTHSS
jgi:serine/threonine-protein phosphatase 2A regulatory subunit B''